MSVITVTGNVDKRVIVYPLMKALGIMGPTGVISDDTSLKRLYRDQGWCGRVSGIDVALTLDLESDRDKIFEDFGNVHTNYLYVTDSYVPPKSDFTLLCRGVSEKSFLEDLYEEVKKDEDKGGALVLTTNEKNKKLFKDAFLVTAEHLKFFSLLEETKELDVPKDPILKKFLAMTFAKPLGMTPDDFFKLLERDELQKTYSKL